MATQLIQDRRISDSVRNISNLMQKALDEVNTELLEKKTWEASSQASQYRTWLNNVKLELEKAKKVRF